MMKVTEAHRKLDAGEPILDEDWKAIERSIWWLYCWYALAGVVTAGLIVYLLVPS